MTYLLNQSVKNLISEICFLHEKYSYKFFSNIDAVNLKKKQIRNVIDDESKLIDDEFIRYVQNYHDFISQLIIEIEFEFEYRDLDFRIRIKQMDSILNKLLHYRFEKKEEGMVPIIKCLNDLLGVRIILDQFDHDNNDVEVTCNDKKLNMYKIEPTKNLGADYKATHIYFIGKNQYFPWELQIWNSDDSERNQHSHKQHKSKRDYIHWPERYKSSRETEKEIGGD